jgi:hypothetical protein
VPEGIGFQTVDADNLPAADDCVSPIAFKAANAEAGQPPGKAGALVERGTIWPADAEGSAGQMRSPATLKAQKA